MRWIFFIALFFALTPLWRRLFSEHGPPHRKQGRVAGDVARLESAIAERDTVIEDLQRRLNELESRLDFTERLLARPRGTERETAV